MKSDSPYTAGVSDGLKCFGMIRASNLATKNRLAFLTLDSILEIALRVFLKHRKRVSLDPIKHRPRAVLLAIAEKNMSVDHSVWEQISYFYEDIRCPLYHQASDMTVTDPILDDFTETVLFLIKEMFSIDGNKDITEGMSLLSTDNAQAYDKVNMDSAIFSKLDKIIIAIGHKPSKDPTSILEKARALGLAKDLTASIISGYLSRGKYFYWSEEEKVWKLTELVGTRRFQELTEKPQ